MTDAASDANVAPRTASMPLHSTISHLVTRRRGVVWLAVALVAAASVFVLVTRMKLDTEVLNLLPRGFESVEGLK
ncbi:MAG: hypothetical protein M3R07_13045, partial [Gemmatimonadota bacterium]|nr:hypothetical protein [Gemmatimonadota bacterium]